MCPERVIEYDSPVDWQCHFHDRLSDHGVYWFSAEKETDPPCTGASVSVFGPWQSGAGRFQRIYLQYRHHPAKSGIPKMQQHHVSENFLYPAAVSPVPRHPQRRFHQLAATDRRSDLYLVHGHKK